jgi:hypothetical protein
MIGLSVVVATPVSPGPTIASTASLWWPSASARLQSTTANTTTESGLPKAITASGSDGALSVRATRTWKRRSSRPAAELSAYRAANTPKTSSARTEMVAAGVRSAGGRIARSGRGAVADTHPSYRCSRGPRRCTDARPVEVSGREAEVVAAEGAHH